MLLPVSSQLPLVFQISFSIPSFFSAVGKEAEGWWEIMPEDVGYAGVTTSFVDTQCNNRGGEMTGLRRRGKKA
jgi:hypothetical protein